ncbi:MAG: ABC transporter ATP-binding protein [Spongiibacteraceae bacterium]
MSEPLPFFARIASVLRLANPPWWAGPLTVVLGLLSASLEGAGLFMFIPLLQSMGMETVHASGIEHVFDRLLSQLPSQHATSILVGILCLTILLKSCVNVLTTLVTGYVNGVVAHRLRSKIFEQTITSCADYSATNRQSDVVTTLAENSWKVSSALGLIYYFIVSVCTFIVFVALMFIISVKLTLIAAAALAVCALMIRGTTRLASDTGQAVVRENKNFGLRMWESISTLQLIRAFGLEAFETKRFAEISDRVRKRLLKMDMLWAVPGPVSEVSITLLIGVLVVASKPAGIGLAATAAFLSLLYRLQRPTREILQARVSIEGLSGALDDVQGYLVATAEPYLREGHRDAIPVKEALELHDVSFRYAESDAWALRNVSIRIPAGKTTAIVGRSGAGKSTLVTLLFRFRDPTAGHITADGVDLSAFRTASWRKQVALMAQEVQLFNDSVEANIQYGDLDADFKKLMIAAEIANADNFIRELPEGYKTIVGDRGARLSGGQRQRIALARTILRNPGILLLDEATNSLDVESEQAFQLALERYTQQRTVVVIAHRLATVQRADQIIVLDMGRVVEVGSPAQLLDGNGHFARMYNLARDPVAAS